jgi:hypothetical protein
VGCPRSGTTLLQALLAAHPDVQSFPESHLFRRVYQGSGWKRPIHGLRARRWIGRFFADLGADPDFPRWARWLPLVPGPLLGRFVERLDRITVENGRSLWIEKTPDHVFYLDRMRRYAPGARVLHIVRDGRAVVASLYRVTRSHPDRWGGPWSVERCVEHWNRAIEATAADTSVHGSLVVRYEELASDPEPVLRSVCAHLGLPYTDQMLSRYGETLPGLIARTETWKLDTGAPVSIRESAFEEVFSPEQRTWIERALVPIPDWTPSADRLEDTAVAG